MRNRFHLGALYYDFWALPAFVSTSPLAAYVHAGMLGTLAVLLVWYLTRALAGAPAGLAAAALLATSPVAVIDGRIAWAPAALPFWSALLLLALVSFARSPTPLRAAALLFLAAFGTQLHVAAAPLALLAGVVVLWHARALSWRGLLLAALGGAAPLLPMLLGLSTAVPSSTGATLAEPTAHRLRDMLLLVPRLITGLSPAGLPTGVRAWLAVEAAVTAATLAAGLFVLLRPRAAGRGRDPGERLIAAALLAGLAAVALLPAEAWYYYLDAVLVPGAVVLAVAWQAVRWRRAAIWLLAGCVVARTLLLAWWIHGAAAAGHVAANLDYLRLGGPRPAAPDARARLLGVATKRAAAGMLARDAGIPLERVWRDVHGSAFADLDTDNGYFFRRATDEVRRGAEGSPRDDGRSALVLYRGDFPADWLARSGPALQAGPLEIRPYAAALDLAAARLVGCGDGAPPAQRPRAPLDYGSGEPALPQWPCATPPSPSRSAPSRPTSRCASSRAPKATRASWTSSPTRLELRSRPRRPERASGSLSRPARPGSSCASRSTAPRGSTCTSCTGSARGTPCFARDSPASARRCPPAWWGMPRSRRASASSLAGSRAGPACASGASSTPTRRWSISPSAPRATPSTRPASRRRRSTRSWWRRPRRRTSSRRSPACCTRGSASRPSPPSTSPPRARASRTP